VSDVVFVLDWIQASEVVSYILGELGDVDAVGGGAGGEGEGGRAVGVGVFVEAETEDFVCLGGGYAGGWVGGLGDVSGRF